MSPRPPTPRPAPQLVISKTEVGVDLLVVPAEHCWIIKGKRNTLKKFPMWSSLATPPKSAGEWPQGQSWQEAQGESGSRASGSVRLFFFAGRGSREGLLFPLADDRAKQPNSVHPPLGRSAPSPARKPTLDVFNQLCKQETNFRIFSISGASRIKGRGFHSPPSLWGHAVACEAGLRKTGARAFYPHMQNECKRQETQALYLL